MRLSAAGDDARTWPIWAIVVTILANIFSKPAHSTVASTESRSVAVGGGTRTDEDSEEIDLQVGTTTRQRADKKTWLNAGEADSEELREKQN